MESKNPLHYQKAIQTCDAIMSQMTPEENIGFLRGSALKYLSYVTALIRTIVNNIKIWKMLFFFIY